MYCIFKGHCTISIESTNIIIQTITYPFYYFVHHMARARWKESRANRSKPAARNPNTHIRHTDPSQTLQSGARERRPQEPAISTQLCGVYDVCDPRVAVGLTLAFVTGSLPLRAEPANVAQRPTCRGISFRRHSLSLITRVAYLVDMPLRWPASCLPGRPACSFRHY